MKQEISNIKLDGLTIGFIYWIQEYHDLRGLKDMNILKYPTKLAELQEEYNRKYPEGLTSWSSEEPDTGKNIKTFDDLTFIPHPISGEGQSAFLEFDNGRGISVITGSSHFLSSEEEPYEVGFLQKDGDLGHIYSQDKGEIELLEEKDGNDIIGYCTPEQVTLIMKAIQKL